MQALTANSIVFIFSLFFNSKFSLAETIFKRNYVGTVFEPYTKYRFEAGFRDNYTEIELVEMLGLISTKFSFVATYGIGTRDSNSSWEEGNASAFVPKIAARLNKSSNKTFITLITGAWTGWRDFPLASREIVNAIEASESANIYSEGSVSGICFSEPVDSDQNKGTVLNLAHFAKAQLLQRNSSLKLGLRALGSCEGLISDLSQKPNPKEVSVNILKELDFIICQKLGEPYQVAGDEARRIGELFLLFERSFKLYNDKLEVLGESGYSRPSASTGMISRNDLVRFWKAMNDWASSKHFLVYMFTAFDEPWKISLGFNEPHFGWWLRVKNDSSGPEAFIEKEKAPDAEPPSKSYGLEISLGIIGAIFLLALVSGVFLIYRKLVDIKDSLLSQADVDAFENGVKGTPGDDETEDALLLPYDRTFEIIRSKLILDEGVLLGRGAFGQVFKAQLDGHIGPVACKTTQSNITASSLKSLLSEIKIMIHVGKHDNVVSIIGAYTGEIRKGIVMIATELCEQGSLEKYLRNMSSSLAGDENYQNVSQDDRYVNSPSNVSTISTKNSMFSTLTKWAYEIASGMEHISSRKVIHADLAARNVLLTIGGVAKITDFGLSRRLYEYSNYVKQNQEPLPWRWMALESLLHLNFSSASDVWSFGVVLFEIYSLGEIPYPGLQWNLDFTTMLTNGLRMNKPHYATEDIYSRMCECWHIVPNDRPDFSTLANIFKELAQNSKSDYTVVEDKEQTEVAA